MSSDAATTLIGVAVGAVLGFLSSLGFEAIQNKRRAKAIRERLWAELRFIRERIQFKMEHKDYAPEKFVTLFDSMTAELALSLDPKRWDRVVRAYQKIGLLATLEPEVQNSQYYSQVETAIDAALHNI